MTSTTLANAGSDPGAVAAQNTAPRGLYRFAVFFAVFTLLHVKGGAMVVSTGSGMAFTDWPLANGSLWPPDMDVHGLFEHLHRIAGAITGMLSIALVVWIARADRRPWLTRTAWALLALIVVQGILGGLGVLEGTEGGRTWTPAAIAHGVLGQITLCVQVFIAFALSSAWLVRVRVPPALARTLRKLAGIAFASVFVQLIVGATFRHTNATNVLWVHVAMALVVSITILIATAYATSRLGRAVPGYRSFARWIYVLLLVQLTLGFVTLAVRRFKDPSNIEHIGGSLIASSHVIVGATLFLMATLLVARAWRNVIPVELER